MSDNEFSQVDQASGKTQNQGLDQPDLIQQDSEPSQTIFEQLGLLVKDMKSIMKNFKVFFNKYLNSDENHFVQREKQTPTQIQQQYSYQPQNKNYNQGQSNLYQSRAQQYSQPQQNGRYAQQYTPMPSNSYSKSQQQTLRQSTAVNKLSFGDKIKKYQVQKKKKQQNLDPNKPKAPLTPYFMFFQQNRDILRQRYPQMSLSEIGSLGGKIWRQLSEQQRQSYKDRYIFEQKKYKNQMMNYNSGGSYGGYGNMNGGQKKTNGNYQYQYPTQIQDLQ